MLLVGVRWDGLGWRDQLDVVEAILGDGLGVDASLDALDDQIAEMFPEQETWGSSPGAMRAQAAAEQQWSNLPRAGESPAAAQGEPRPAPPVQRRVVRSGHPLEGPLFFLFQRALMAVPRPPPPPTITPE